MSEDVLIYKRKLIKDILDLPDCYNGFSDTFDKSSIIGVIDEQQTIAPVSQLKWERDTAIEQLRQLGYSLGEKPRRGRWTKIFGGGGWWYACSECGHHIPRTRYGNDWHSKYCPNCGARMDGEEG